jgi:hypothetical protein
MRTVLTSITATAGVAAFLVGGAPTPARAESFAATVVSGYNPARTTWDGQSADPPLQITIHLDEWSTPSDIREVQATLATFGPSVMRRRGEERAIGRVIASSWEFRLGPWTVVLASEGDTSAGRVVRLVTDRPAFVLSNWSQDLGFDPSTRRLYTGVIELTLDAEGGGTGVLMPVAAVVFDDEGGFAIEKASEKVGAHKLIQVKAW